MRDPERIGRITAKLHELWAMQPDTRFVQMILNALPTDVGTPYYVEDEVMEKKLDEKIAWYKNRKSEQGKNEEKRDIS